MKKVILLTLVFIINFQMKSAFGLPCCQNWSASYDWQGVWCSFSCITPRDGQNAMFGSVAETTGNCPIIGEIMCYDWVYQHGGQNNCAPSGGNGGTSYGGCMGGGYTTGGKPAPAPGKVIKSLVIPGQ